MEKKYITIVSDIRHSKERTKENKTFQEKLMLIAEKVNEHFGKTFVKKLELINGDEFQVMFSDPKSLFSVLEYIKVMLFPESIRIGIGIGTKVEHGTNGESWWFARDMVNEIKEKCEPHGSVITDIRIKGIMDKEKEALINYIFSLLTIIRSRWTKTHIKIINELIEYDVFGKDFQKNIVALHFGYKESNFSKLLKTMKYAEYVAALNQIQEIIGKEV